MGKSKEIVVLLPATVLFGNQLFRFFRTYALPGAYPFHPVMQRSRNEYIHTGHVPKHIVGSTADEYGASRRCYLADSVTLNFEK